MSLLKRILANDTVRKGLCWLAANYIRFAYATCRWTVVGGETPRRYWDRNQPFILCFWHGRLMMMPYCWDRKIPIHMLISEHRDGQIIARTVGHFGIRTVAGSSTRGGAAALRTMLKKIKGGECVGITPDGPHGPRMRASDGVVTVARLTGAPIIPATYSVTRRRQLSSWDRFLVAWPFGRGVLIWGEPIRVPRDADGETREALRLKVEDALNAISEQADLACGKTPVEPAPVAVKEAL